MPFRQPGYRRTSQVWGVHKSNPSWQTDLKVDRPADLLWELLQWWFCSPAMKSLLIVLQSSSHNPSGSVAHSWSQGDLTFLRDAKEICVHEHGGQRPTLSVVSQNCPSLPCCLRWVSSLAWVLFISIDALGNKSRFPLSVAVIINCATTPIFLCRCRGWEFRSSCLGASTTPTELSPQLKKIHWISACHAPWRMEPAWPWSSHESEADSSFLCSRMDVYLVTHPSMKQGSLLSEVPQRTSPQTNPSRCHRHLKTCD